MRKLFLSLIACTAISIAFAQNNPFAGTWAGKLNVGVELRIVFHISDNGKGGIAATIDSPDQGAFGMKADTAYLAGTTINITMGKVGASVNGQLINDSTIEGHFKQSAELPLTLKKTLVVEERKRPQQPKPPYPYRSEDVEYDNADRSLHYGATLTIPDGTGPFPAVVLITGSGQQARDEDLMGHKPFLVLADALTRNGIAVLRVDDRGIGKSTGDFNASTSADFAKDVNTSVDYLLSRAEVNKKKLGLIGHSEGGMIAPMVATSRKDIAFVVLLAAPGIKIDSLMAEQNARILLSTGISEQAVNLYTPVYRKITQLMTSTTDSATALQAVNSYLDQWVKKSDTAIIKELGLTDPVERTKMSSSMIHTFNKDWFRYFFVFDPAPYLKKMTGKVLALNGDKDIQVIASSNIPGIEAALKKSKVKTYKAKILPGLNHLFQTCKTCTVMEYGQLEETFSPVALQEINDWLNKEVKN